MVRAGLSGDPRYPEQIGPSEDRMNRSLDRWKRDVVEALSLSEFLSTPVTPGALHSIKYGRSVIDMTLDAQPGAPLVVFLNGAITDRTKVTPPVFAGFGVLDRAQVSLLCINDPSVYLSDTLGLAWYAGWDGVELRDDLVSIVRKVAGDIGASRIAFIGGSGGGFAAMSLSYDFPGSLAIAWNPQTDLFDYAKVHVDAYLEAAWGTTDLDEARTRMAYQAIPSLRSLYAHGQTNFVLYLQNESDWHVRAHLMPMLAKLGAGEPRTGFVRPNLYLHMDDFGEGHAVPPKEFLQALFSDIFSESWEKRFRSRFTPSAVLAARHAPVA